MTDALAALEKSMRAMPPSAAVAPRGPRMMILPVASGKGGVGKTTVAVNMALALSRFGKTVLVDLDTGTSSVRACLPGEPAQDLYHFFKKGIPLGDCLTPLPESSDPDGEFTQFRYVAAPAHFMDELVNLNTEKRERVMRAINGLDARFVICDLRAGAEDSVLDFLPIANSGILVFTPNLPAATLAAADLVKAGLFRKLRALFGAESPLWRRLSGPSLKPLVDDLMLRVEDPYDDSIPNLDAFLADLHHALGNHPVVVALYHALEHYQVYFVLNRFDAVNEAYESAIKPFVETLTKFVSARLRITNLGWILESPEVHESNRKRRPLLLKPEAAAAYHPRMKSRAQLEMDQLQAVFGGFKQRQEAPPAPISQRAPDPGPQLSAQLEALKNLFSAEKKQGPRDNINYIASRILWFTENALPGELGDERLFTPSEAMQALARF